MLLWESNDKVAEIRPPSRGPGGGASAQFPSCRFDHRYHARPDGFG